MGRLPFIFSKETERAAIDRVVRNAKKRALLYEMVDVVLRVRETGQVSPEEIGPVLAGLEATDEAVFARAAGWLAKLHRFEPKLGECLDRLASDKRVVVRRNLCACLNYFPKEIAVPLLRKFVRDSNARVRGTARAVAVQMGLRELIPDFKARSNELSKDDEGRHFKQAIKLLEGKTLALKEYRMRRLPNGDIVSF